MEFISNRNLNTILWSDYTHRRISGSSTRQRKATMCVVLIGSEELGVSRFWLEVLRNGYTHAVITDNMPKM